MSEEIDVRRVPRQARSQQRYEHILDATAELIATEGYESLTTNAIAEHAGVSVGSVYQYFDNKEAVVGALAERYLDQMTALNAAVFTDDLATIPIDDVIDHVIGSFIAFHRTHPAFSPLFVASDISETLQAAVGMVDAATLAQIKHIILVRKPGLEADRAETIAAVAKTAVKALLALMGGAGDVETGDRYARETKRMLVAYLREIEAEAD